MKRRHLAVLLIPILAVLAYVVLPDAASRADEEPAVAPKSAEGKEIAQATGSAQTSKSTTATSTEGTSTDGSKSVTASAKETASKTYPALLPGMGALEGKVVLAGAPPAPEAFEVPTSNKDHAACVAHVRSERLTLSANKEIRDVVIAVSGYKPKTRVKPQKNAVINNDKCSFVPHVLAVTRGTRVQLTNDDPFMHNAHGLLGNEFNLAVMKGVPQRQRLAKPGWTALQCDIHPWMKGHIHVFEHNLFDVSDAAGNFKLVNIPPGEYEIEVWHEKVAFSFDPKTWTKVGKVKIEAGKTARLDFSLPTP